MAFLSVYFDLQSFSGLEEKSQEMINSEWRSISSPSNIHELRMALIG